MFCVSRDCRYFTASVLALIQPLASVRTTDRTLFGGLFSDSLGVTVGLFWCWVTSKVWLHTSCRAHGESCKMVKCSLMWKPNSYFLQDEQHKMEHHRRRRRRSVWEVRERRLCETLRAAFRRCSINWTQRGLRCTAATFLFSCNHYLRLLQDRDVSAWVRPVRRLHCCPWMFRWNPFLFVKLNAFRYLFIHQDNTIVWHKSSFVGRLKIDRMRVVFGGWWGLRRDKNNGIIVGGWMENLRRPGE